jgi:transposase
MRRKYFVTLTKQEQTQLREIISKRSSKSVIVKRAYVLLALDENNPSGRKSDEEIRSSYQVAQRTIERLRQRFVEDGFEIALNGKKQTCFKEKSFDGRVEAELVTLRCSDAPDGYEHWTLRLLAETLAENKVVESISHETVRQILKKTNLNRGKSNNG